jgi:hypothetical protein
VACDGLGLCPVGGGIYVGVAATKQPPVAACRRQGLAKVYLVDAAAGAQSERPVLDPCLRRATTESHGLSDSLRLSDRLSLVKRSEARGLGGAAKAVGTVVLAGSSFSADVFARGSSFAGSRVVSAVGMSRRMMGLRR